MYRYNILTLIVLAYKQCTAVTDMGTMCSTVTLKSLTFAHKYLHTLPVSYIVL